MFQEIRTGNWKFQEEDWEQISPEAREFVKRLLHVDPEQRWTVDTAIESPWIHAEAKGDPALSNLSTSMDTLRQRRSALRKLTNPVIWEDEELGDDNPIKSIMKDFEEEEEGE